MEIKQRVKEFMLTTDDGAVLPDDASFIERSLLDSTAVLELVAFLEDTFDIKVEDQEIVPENLDSLNLVEGYVLRKRSTVDAKAA